MTKKWPAPFPRGDDVEQEAVEDPMDKLTDEQWDAVYSGDCDLAEKIFGYKVCGIGMVFDPSDPAPVCMREQGHDGPHIVDSCIQFTDEGNAKRVLKRAKQAEEIYPECGTAKEFLDFIGCDENGYPKKEGE